MALLEFTEKDIQDAFQRGVSTERNKEALGVGDEFTHNRTGVRFVCVSVTRMCSDDADSIMARLEIESAAQFDERRKNSSLLKPLSADEHRERFG